MNYSEKYLQNMRAWRRGTSAFSCSWMMHAIIETDTGFLPCSELCILTCAEANVALKVETGPHTTASNLASAAQINGGSECVALIAVGSTGFPFAFQG